MEFFLKHTFEIIEVNDEMKTDFNALLGSDILPKLKIYLSGVAHAWPQDLKQKCLSLKILIMIRKMNKILRTLIMGPLLNVKI